MRNLLSVVLAISLLACSSCFLAAQSDDDDFRSCDGMPGPQTAYVMALAGGDLQIAVAAVLKNHPEDNLRNVETLLFYPTPTSLLQLMGRLDTAVGSIDTANELRLALNKTVSAKLNAVHITDTIMCSMSLLSYREASDVFGKRIANQYGVVQVTIRNKDANHEFLLHQLDYWFGDTFQYYAARDRKIARGVAEKGQAVDPRNTTVRIVEGVGSVAGASTAVFGGDALIGSSIYNSTFVPALKMIFPDLTVPQIAKIDDMGFSSGATSMLIPKSGAVSVVTFIPSDSVMVPKLAQYELQLGVSDKTAIRDQFKKCAKTREALVNKKVSKDDKGEAIANQPEIDAVRDACSIESKPESPEVLLLSGSTLAGTKGQSKHRKYGTQHYKSMSDFDPAAVLLLQRDLHIFVSGSHIQQLSNQQPSISAVSCKEPDFYAQGESVSCSVTGAHLDQLTQARLELDSTSPIAATARVIDPKDPTTGIFNFDACAFSPVAAGDYFLEVTNSNGVTQLINNRQKLTPVLLRVSCVKNAAASFDCQVAGTGAVPVNSLQLIPKAGAAVPTAASPVGFTVAPGTTGTFTPKVNISPGGKSKDLSPCSSLTLP